VALEQVVAAEDDELPLFLAIPSFQDALHGHLQVIVADAPRYTSKVMESHHVPFEERFLLLSRKGSHE
jgi:hypothetical protein